MTPPPGRDATAESGDTGGQATGPGGPAGAEASAGSAGSSGTGAAGAGSSGTGAAGAGTAGPGPANAARSRRRRRLSWWSELLVLFVLALAIMLVIKTYVVQAFYIPSSSMENTLNIGDKVLVNKLIYHFRSIDRGDVIVFNGEGSWDPPSPPQSSDPVVRLASEFGHAVVGLFGISPGVHDYIKRVIGVPGDHVACCDAEGRVTVNGVALNEKSYLYPNNPPSMTKFHITVPAGPVVGDGRPPQRLLRLPRPHRRTGRRHDPGEPGGRPGVPDPVAAEPVPRAAHPGHVQQAGQRPGPRHPGHQ